MDFIKVDDSLCVETLLLHVLDESFVDTESAGLFPIHSMLSHVDDCELI